MITLKQRFAILAAILVSSAAFAQNGVVKGKVTDESGEPLALHLPLTSSHI